MITIRPAQPNAEDASAFVELAEMAAGQLLRTVLKDRGLAMMSALFLRNRNHFSHHHVRFAMIEGRIAGMLHGLGDDSSRPNDLRTTLLQLRFLSWRLPAIMVRSWPLRRVIEFVNQRHSGHFYISYVAVHPRFRRQGVARSLMAEAEALARLDDCTTLSLSVDPNDRAAMEFYRSCGLSEIARSPTGHFHGREEVFVRMEKPLP